MDLESKDITLSGDGPPIERIKAIFTSFSINPGTELTIDDLRNIINKSGDISNPVNSAMIKHTVKMIRVIDPELLALSSEDGVERLKLLTLGDPDVLTARLLSKGGFSEPKEKDSDQNNRAKIKIISGKHSIDPPKGAHEKLSDLFTLAGIISSDKEFEVTIANKIACRPNSPTYKIGPITRGGSFTVLVKASDNDSRWSYYVFGQHGFSAEDIHRRISSVIESLKDSNNEDRGGNRKSVSRILKGAGIEDSLIAAVRKLSHRHLTKLDFIKLLTEFDIDVAHGALIRYLLNEKIIEKASRQKYIVSKPKKVEEPVVKVNDISLAEMIIPKKMIKKISALATSAKRYGEIIEEIRAKEAIIADLRIEADGLKRSKEDYDMLIELLSGERETQE